MLKSCPIAITIIYPIKDNARRLSYFLNAFFIFRFCSIDRLLRNCPNLTNTGNILTIPQKQENPRTKIRIDTDIEKS